MIDIKVENKTREFLDQFEKGMERALYAIGVTAQADIVRYMSEPDFTGEDIVDTGRLRASMSFVTPENTSKLSDLKAFTAKELERQQKTGNIPKSSDKLSPKIKETRTVILGTNVEYAQTVNSKRKFMENSLEPNFDKYQKLAEEMFKGNK